MKKIWKEIFLKKIIYFGILIICLHRLHLFNLNKIGFEMPQCNLHTQHIFWHFELHFWEFVWLYESRYYVMRMIAIGNWCCRSTKKRIYQEVMQLLQFSMSHDENIRERENHCSSSSGAHFDWSTSQEPLLTFKL